MSGEEIAGGVLGKLAGRAKQLAGAGLGRDDLQREGRLQEVQAEADREAADLAAKAERKQEQADLKAERAETEAERHQVEQEAREIEAEEATERRLAQGRLHAERPAEAEAGAAERERQAREGRAEAERRQAADEKAEASREADELKRKARRAEEAAAAIDPKEESR